MVLRVQGRATWVRRLSVLYLLSAGACGRAGSESTEPLELGQGPTPSTPAPSIPAASDAPGADPSVSPEVPATAAIPLGLPGSRLPDDPRRTQLIAMLERECSACHEGPSAERDRFLDLEMLLVDAMRPGAAETSYLVTWLQYGDARREHAGVRVSTEELGVLIDYVNSLPSLEDCPGYDHVDRDRAQELMLSDISRRAPADRPFIRYVGALQASPPSGCSSGPPGLGAFVNLVNTISLSPEIVPFGEVVEGAPMFALDLRDYGWATPIDVDGSTPGHFADRWSAIVAGAGPYALELQGPEADAVKQQTQTSVPLLSATVFVASASAGPLYAALVGVGSDVSALATSLGVDAEGSTLQRAAVFGADALPDRVVTRHEQGVSTGSAWWTREELEGPGGASGTGLARDPVHYASRGTEVMFTLPNGLFAFAVAGADGRRLDELPCTSDLPCTGSIRARTSVTCRACHGDSPGSVTDEVLPYLDADPSRYSAELVPLVREQYRDDLWRPLEADQARAFAAREAVGVRFGNGSIPLTYHDFKDHPLGAVRAADDLGVQVEQLRAAVTALGNSAPELAPLLADGEVDRDTFTAYFQRLACAIEGPRNQPSRCP
jgi:hypothetical protein